MPEVIPVKPLNRMKIRNAQAQPAPHTVHNAAMIAMIFVLVFTKISSPENYIPPARINILP
ncbi:MAG: hypothetical protein A3K46_08810 [Chloroflexi bacterium RBG_13_60_9]|nr:MAG: hypothetical protein A3K46_08810 [Chloroflexi bacterium RBG_13_60_9]